MITLAASCIKERVHDEYLINILIIIGYLTLILVNTKKHFLEEKRRKKLVSF